MGGRRGYTMIEVLVAMAVFAIGAFAILSFQVAMLRSSEMSRDLSDASYVMNLRLEELALLPVDDLLGACPGARPCMDGGEEAAIDLEPCSLRVDGQNRVDAAGRYRMDLAVEPHAVPGAATMTLSICWRDFRGLLRQVQGVRVVGGR